MLLKFHLDSVEDGDKVVKTAIDNFGRVGKLLRLVSYLELKFRHL